MISLLFPKFLRWLHHHRIIFTFFYFYFFSFQTGSIHIITPPATLHMLWMLPQTIILAFAELMFQITYLSFIFTEVSSSIEQYLSQIWHCRCHAIIATSSFLFHRFSSSLYCPCTLISTSSWKEDLIWKLN